MFLSKMYLTQYKGNIIKCSELWYIRTDVHFIVLSDLKLYKIIHFQGSENEFEGLKQCRMAKTMPVLAGAIRMKNTSQAEVSLVTLEA